MVKQLGAHPVAHSLPINAINATSTISKGMIQITMRALQDDFSKRLTCLTIPTIADSIPSEVFPRNSIEIPSNIRLADQQFHIPRSVDLLIGSGATLSMFSVGQINLSHKNYDLYLQKTRLGWVVAGSTHPRMHKKTRRAI